MAKSTELLVSLSLEHADESEIYELTRQLRAEIEQLNVDAVDSVYEGNVPEGTKAIDWASVGNFIVTLAPTVVPALFGVLQSWIERQPSVSVKIKVKVGRKTAEIEYDPTKTSAEDLDRLVKSLGKTIKK